MKNMIHGLACSNVRRNRSRSVLIILSIFLTTLLLSSVAGIGCGLVRHNQANAGIIYGNYCATFSRVTEEQYEEVKLRSEVTHVGRSAYAAQVKPEGKDGSMDMSLVFMDKQEAENKNFFNSLEAGALPVEENEITASEEFFAQLGLKHARQGDVVAVPFRRDNQSKYKEKEFVVSGVIKSKKNGIAQKSSEGYISQKFYDALHPQEMRSYQVTFRLSDSVEINGGNCEEVLQELGKICGIEKDTITPNFPYLMWAYDPGIETVSACVVIAILVVLVSVAVIYNIFQAGMVQKIQEYGKIKALGATKKQIKKLVLREGMLLSAVGIPLGLLAGCGVALVVFQMLMHNAGELWDVGMERVSVISLPLMALVVLSALVTMRLALAHPMRVASRISPVEAIRYQEDTSRKKGMRKGHKNISVLGMTLSSLSANRRRTLSTILTMGLSCVLFVSLSHVAGNIDNEIVARSDIEYGQFSIELDWTLNDTAYPENNLDSIQEKNPLGEEFQQKLKEIPEITQIRARKIFAVENRSASSMDEEGDCTSVCVMGKEEFERYGQGSTLGNVDYDAVNAAGGIVWGYSYFLESYGYELGQQIDMKDLAGGKAPYQGKIMGAFGSAPASWIITEDTFRKLGITGDVTETLWVDCKEEDKGTVEAAIQEVLAGVEHIETNSYDNALQTARSGTAMMQGGVYLFLGLLGIIGFLNMANTIITGAVTRKRELGVLQAVGMTNRQLNQTLQLEGILFSAGTVAVSLIAGSPLGYALFLYAKEKQFYGINEYHFPVVEIGIMVLAILLLQAVLSFLLSRNLRRESLVERISYQG